MPRKTSAALVIDATVTCAAGETEHPVSSACRSFLQEVLKICHRVVLTPEILAEYNEHRSYFGYRWFGPMKARKKVVRLDAVEDPGLRETIHSLELTDNVRETILKDIHLVEAAFATGQKVASLDETVRGHLRQIAASVRSLKSLVWVNPARDDERATDWLRQGANAEEERQLGFNP
jgi:predicted nucleic acid-binding protein